MATTPMARPTFLQKVFRRPSQKYASATSTTEPIHPAPQRQSRTSRDFHSTKGELLRIAAELNREDCIDVACYQQEKPCESIQNEMDVAAIALDSTRYHSTSEEAQAPYGAGREFNSYNISPDKSLDPQVPEDVFYTPDSSPKSSRSPADLSPSTSRPQTPVHSPSPTPPISATSSCASLGSANPQDVSVSTTSLPQSSTSAEITMIPVNNEPRRYKRISDHRKLTYTDDDWAKDVRWLVAPQHSGASEKNKSRVTRRNTAPSGVSSAASLSTSSLSSSVSSPSAMKSHSYDLLRADPPSPYGRKSKGHGMNPKATRAVVGMTVLLEVEEDIDLSESGNPAGADRSMSHRRSQSLSYAPKHTLKPPKQEPSQPTPKLTRRRSSSYPSPFQSGTPSRSSSVRLHSRATNVASQTGTSASGFQPPTSITSRPMSSSSHMTSSTTRSPYTSAPSNMLDALAAHASSSRETGSLPSSGTRGFSGLVLPRAASSPAASGSMSSARPWKGGRGASTTETLGLGLGFGDEIDLTRAGLAQTTMASVEIVRGIAFGSVQRKESKSRKPLFGLGWLSKNNIKSEGEGKGKARQVAAESPLAFTAYRKPPVYVGGNSVLVQVWAVGLDGVDAQLVGVHPPSRTHLPPGIINGLEKDRSTAKDKKRHVPPVGYIPGRSFVGRVLEVGWDVDENIVRKGEWVVGLNSVLKCGALTEFILVDRHRIHHIPHPHMLNHPSLTLASLDNTDDDHGGGKRNSLVFPSVNEPKGLTVDELALLPLSGVAAYRAVRTLHYITHTLARPGLAARRSSRHSYDVTSDTDEDDDDVVIVHPIKSGLADKQSGETRPRVLILRGHDGPGALALQILVRAGWSVWVHVPVPFDLPGPPDQSERDFKDEEEERILGQRRVVLERIERRLREWGADEVLFVPIESSFTSTSFRSSAPTQRDVSFSPLTSVHHPQSPSSTPSPSISPSPFSRSPTSSPLSSPSLTQLEPSSHDHLSSSCHPSTSHCVPPAPYSYTGLPLTPYKTEATSVTALFAYLARARVRFEAVIDTIGGREIWEAGRTLLSLPIHDAARSRIDAQFTTLVGDAPDRVVSTASDNFHAGVRALRIGKAKDMSHVPDDPAFSPPTAGPVRGKKHKKVKPRPVNYAWVNVMSDVDWHGADVHDSLREVLAAAVEQGVRPAVGPVDFADMSDNGKGKMKAVFSGGDGEKPGKVIPFENTPHIFVPGGGLEYGGTVVSRIVW